MIPDIRNTILRRFALVLTVVSIIVCIGPLALITAVLGWIEREYEVNLAAIWRGEPTRGTK